ncbi:MAG: hypothetical protein FWF29_07065, partial [Treponema sp.]|nr:hypothetical protein [Treponema sp.]
MKMIIKRLLTIFILASLAALYGCTLFVSPPHTSGRGSGGLSISVGISPPDGSRKTYTPVADIYNFTKVTLVVSKENVQYANITINPQYDSLTVELVDIPYDTYTITAKAYINDS